MGKLVVKIVVMAIIILKPTHSFANDTLSTREDVMSFLEDAFYAQVSLSEKKRSLHDVHRVLNPFFTKEYQVLFLKENLIKENNKYFTFGSDFAAYSIPYFQFSEHTQVNVGKDKVYVYEHFNASKDGPVAYDSHYEGILIEKINSKWKVSKLLNDEEISTYLAKNPIQNTSLSTFYWESYLTTLVFYNDVVFFSNFNATDLTKLNNQVGFQDNQYQRKMPNPALF
ncbi:DUF3993 domain-containing protein [Niallia sp. 03133]|uniref:DUF3993 domain-containing protein n=1 Tax=Niallia sp. 03133 TaxID=3458060 RepID=UPI0040447559